MSPRPVPSRDDETAQRFLAAAAQLIDVYLHADPKRREQSARLKQIRFPAALEWLRTEDVIRLAAAKGSEGASHRRSSTGGRPRTSSCQMWWSTPFSENTRQTIRRNTLTKCLTWRVSQLRS